LIGCSKKINTLYCIDFGLSKRFINPATGSHVEFKKINIVTGTPRYCSINAHRGYTQGRRDDLESIANMIVYFTCNGWLPWMDAEEDEEELLKNKNEKPVAHKCACKIKKNCSFEDVTKGCPYHVIEFYRYTRSLQYEQKPDYKYCLEIFNKFLRDSKFELKDDKWDWDIHREKCIKEKERAMEAKRVEEAMKKIPKKNVKQIA
jgi:serine/threonine protein kinase